MTELERIVGDLREDFARLDSDVRHLRPVVEKLTSSVDTLTEALNRSKGAVWMLMFVSGAMGAMMAFVIDLFRGKQ